ncbi:putative methyltransferase DDB_G0268948 [Acanthaster planci]|uniref:Methyltransferase DDB_G0268948 n=1 Tax=Acanthaster planci TaxID=133434 RepID=A0A8B7ZBH2_ACAPL|nr:putative methyltransferase DDB_G0268948 [Acanthaster planci]
MAAPAPVKLFEGATHASVYLKYRPSLPQKIFESIVEYLQEKHSKPFKLAVDVGCGSGQGTQPLAPHFERVIGIDVSEAQIAAALKRDDKPPNVEYRTGQGEKIPVPDNSVCLVTCFQAAHWLDYTAFCKEVDRVLQPSGCMAISSHGSLLPEGCDGDETTDKRLQELHTDFCEGTVLGPYWDHHRTRHNHNLFADFSIPYPGSIRDDSYQLVWEMTVPSYIGFLSSLSALRTYLKKNPSSPNPLDEFQDRLKEIFDAKAELEQIKVRLKAPVVLLLGRKPLP